MAGNGRVCRIRGGAQLEESCDLVDSCQAQRWNDVTERINHDRRCFLGTAATTLSAGMWGGVEANKRAPRELAAIGGAAEWLNSPRLTPPSLAGKVVLVDFWTYTCINWLRTLPYVRAWAQKYRQGLVVIGVHTPEFTFEHNLDNVRRAVRQMRIEYPVVIDNDYAIWRAFRNQYWPALYFIDARGRVRQHHFGEGEYLRSEATIQRLLAEAGVAGLRDGDVVPVAADGVEAAADWDNLKSPETYVGYARMQNFASHGSADSARRRVYAAPARLALNQWALAGEWTMGKQATVLSRPNGRIVNRFHARDLHLVMGPSRSESPVRCRVTIDGQPPGSAHGLDIDEGGNGTVVDQRLYQLIRQPKPVVDRTFEMEFLDAGVETFAFTFG
jgi:thiol-disulfide isomerase/thioredoxin